MWILCLDWRFLFDFFKPFHAGFVGLESMWVTVALAGGTILLAAGVAYLEFSKPRLSPTALTASASAMDGTFGEVYFDRDALNEADSEVRVFSPIPLKSQFSQDVDELRESLADLKEQLEATKKELEQAKKEFESEKFAGKARHNLSDSSFSKVAEKVDFLEKDKQLLFERLADLENAPSVSPKHLLQARHHLMQFEKRVDVAFDLLKKLGQKIETHADAVSRVFSHAEKLEEWDSRWKDVPSSKNLEKRFEIVRRRLQTVENQLVENSKHDLRTHLQKLEHKINELEKELEVRQSNAHASAHSNAVFSSRVRQVDNRLDHAHKRLTKLENTFLHFYSKPGASDGVFSEKLEKLEKAVANAEVDLTGLKEKVLFEAKKSAKPSAKKDKLLHGLAFRSKR